MTPASSITCATTRCAARMMCNIFGKVDAARELIKQGARVTPEELRGAIK